MNKIFMNKSISIIILCIICFTLIGFGIFLGAKISRHSNTIEYGFKDVGELVTQEYRIRKVKDAS